VNHDDWHALGASAAQKLRDGHAAEAAELFQRMTALRPDDADGWFNLGYARRAARQYEGALEAYGEALERGVSSPEEARINRSVILSEFLHRIPEAADELRKAVEANPRALLAWINLGGLHDDLGDTQAAREAYQNALKVDSRSGRVMARIAAIDIHEGRAGEAIAMLRGAIDQGPRTSEDRAELLFALGNALDAEGEFHEAFQVIREANQTSAMVRPPNLRYDPQEQEQLVDALIATPPLKSAGAFPLDRSPIFICGMFRSGSTLVEQLLARHPSIAAGGELEFIPAMVREELRPYPQMLGEASTDRLRQLRDEYLEQLRGLHPGAARVTDKRPDNFLHIGLIKALFPAARVVHTVRNPLDNILSAYFLYFGDAVRYSERLEDIVHFYAQYRRLMAHWRERFGADIHDVDYDRVVSEPRGELEPLVEFLSLSWDDACLRHESGEAVRTASNWQVRQPLYDTSSGRWRNYEQELAPVRDELARRGLI